jgi:hypothetical protein
MSNDLELHFLLNTVGFWLKSAMEEPAPIMGFSPLTVKTLKT